MKKSSPSAWPRVTRITPSAPMPVCRSHTAATKASASGCSSARSSSITKSLPVPWYFQMWICSATQVLRRVVHEGRRAGPPRLEPPDPGVPPEPGELPARERLRALDDQGDRFLQGQLPLQVPRHLSVPDGLARREPSREARERLPRELDDLERPDRAPDVVGFDLDRRLRVCGREPLVEAARAHQLGLALQGLPHIGVRRREGEAVHHGPEVEAP